MITPTKLPKHTPGPWKWEHNEGICPQVVLPGKRGQKGYISMNQNEIQGTDEKEANAWLIAKAPELLDSCMEYKNLLELLTKDEHLWGILRRNNAEFAARVSLQMDLHRVTKRVTAAIEGK